jgi:hypothetical protein
MLSAMAVSADTSVETPAIASSMSLLPRTAPRSSFESSAGDPSGRARDLRSSAAPAEAERARCGTPDPVEGFSRPLRSSYHEK